MNTRIAAISATILLLALAASAGAVQSAPPAKPPEHPAEIRVVVAPEAVGPGDEARVTVTLVPMAGVKINKYPKMRVQVDAQPGLVGAAEVAVGNSEPPPEDQLLSNYYKTVDPMSLVLKVDAGAPRARHKIPAKVSYFYCIPSGFCAPKKETVTIPLTVR